MSYKLYESWDGAIEFGQLINHADDRICMTFTPHARHTVTSVKFRVWRDAGDTPGTATLSLQGVDGSNKPDGANLATATSDSDTWVEGSPGSLIEWTFSSPAVVVTGTRYALVVNVPGSSAAEPVTVGYNVNGTPHYTGGEYGTSADGGANWTLSADVEFIFYEYGVRVEGPTSCWPLNETSGTNIVDTCDANNGTWAGTGAQALTSVLAPNLRGLVIDGADDVISVPVSPNLDVYMRDELTLSVWIRPVSTGEADQGRIVNKLATGVGYRFLIRDQSSNDATIEMTVGTVGTDPLVRALVENIIGQWTHVVTTYNEDGDRRLKLYANGVLLSLSLDNAGGGAAIDDTAIPLSIGNVPTLDRCFDGAIDSALVYDYALNSGEIRKLYQDTIGKGSPPDPIMFGSWGF